ncbi:MAG TPA: E2/UBC family protein [Methylotenera sp.]
MAILTNEDYSKLEAMNLKYKEDNDKRFLVFLDFQLKPGLYQINSCDILVVIPETYPNAGNDMFWTNPRLQRTDGMVIPGTIPADQPEANRDVRIFEGKIYERWSRHWNSGNQLWRAGKDEISTIVNRLTYVLANSHEA